MHKIFAVFIALIFLSSCNNSGQQSYTVAIDGSWDKKQAKDIDFDIQDNQSPKNIVFVVRNNNDYPFSNLRLIGTIIDAENKVISKDTLNYILAKPNGQWLGTGFGDTKELAIPYKTDFKFVKNGKYKLTVVQAMRRDKLPGIEDVGIKILNVKP